MAMENQFKVSFRQQIILYIICPNIKYKLIDRYIRSAESRSQNGCRQNVVQLIYWKPNYEINMHSSLYSLSFYFFNCRPEFDALFHSQLYFMRCTTLKKNHLQKVHPLHIHIHQTIYRPSSSAGMHALVIDSQKLSWFFFCKYSHWCWCSI